MSPERDAYSVLQVAPTAEMDVIRAAYRALARRYHPDGTCPDPERMAELNRAYERLKHPDVRRSYDAGHRPRVGVGPGRPGTLYERWVAATRPPDDGPAAAVLDFGTYEGWRIADVARQDPGYLRWLSRHSSGVRYRRAIAACLPDSADIGRTARIIGRG
ncbi:MAG TPA: DnaJ domain-containing protein [Candidatus Limnocylindrales bacterium]|nr:DnaJ domain-containing protein [Candidatus Limnocylindrales bacterium]